jgi:hypothetical protein
MWNRDWPLESIDRFSERLFETQLGEVLETSERCRANWVMGLLGDKAWLQAAWTQAAGWQTQPAASPR